MQNTLSLVPNNIHIGCVCICSYLRSQITRFTFRNETDDASTLTFLSSSTITVYPGQTPSNLSCRYSVNRNHSSYSNVIQLVATGKYLSTFFFQNYQRYDSNKLIVTDLSCSCSYISRQSGVCLMLNPSQ